MQNTNNAFPTPLNLLFRKPQENKTGQRDVSERLSSVDNSNADRMNGEEPWQLIFKQHTDTLWMKRFSCEHTLDLPTLGHAIVKAQSTILTAGGLKIGKKKGPQNWCLFGSKSRLRYPVTDSAWQNNTTLTHCFVLDIKCVGNWNTHTHTHAHWFSHTHTHTHTHTHSLTHCHTYTHP